MNLFPIVAGRFKLDGGAMFGVVPKSIWQRTNPADEDNLIDLCARCLLIESGDRLILVDTGMGDKQSERFFNYYKPWGNDNLVDSVIGAGFHPNDVTDVLLTHLHFDHCGGCLRGMLTALLLFLFFQMRITGQMSLIGNGLPSPILVKKLPF